MPRWVKVALAISVALILLVGILLLSGHGPSRHMGSGIAVSPSVANGE